MEKLSEIKTPLEDKSQYLRELASNFKKGQVFQVALELDIFTQLKTPRTAETLSKVIGTAPEITGRFLDVLTALGLLDKMDGTYTTSPELYPFLSPEEPYYSKQLLLGDEEWENWLALKQLLKTGGLRQKEGDEYQYPYEEELMEQIARTSLLGRLQKTLKAICAFPEFKTARSLIDLGGGHGLFGIGLAQENPELEVTIFDRPGIAGLSRTYIKKYGMEARVRAVEGDYVTDELGTGFDLALELCSFEGNLAQARQFYRNVYSALGPGGLFIIQTFELDADRTGPVLPLLHDLYKKMASRNMYIMDTGEITGLLKDSGFENEKVLNFSETGLCSQLVVVRKGKKQSTVRD